MNPNFNKKRKNRMRKIRTSYRDSSKMKLKVQKMIAQKNKRNFGSRKNRNKEKTNKKRRSRKQEKKESRSPDLETKILKNQNK